MAHFFSWLANVTASWLSKCHIMNTKTLFSLKYSSAWHSKIHRKRKRPMTEGEVKNFWQFFYFCSRHGNNMAFLDVTHWWTIKELRTLIDNRRSIDEKTHLRAEINHHLIDEKSPSTEMQSYENISIGRCRNMIWSRVYIIFPWRYKVALRYLRTKCQINLHTVK